MDTKRELTRLIEKHIKIDGTHETEINHLNIIRASTLTEPLHSIIEPSVCFIVQGSKLVMLGEELFHYDSSQYLVTSVHLPIRGKITEADEEKPYLCIRLGFTTEQILEAVANQKEADSYPPRRAMLVNKTTSDMTDALVRLLKLLDSPKDIPVLAPLYQKEILYRILQNEDGDQIKQFAILGSHAQAIKEVIQIINHAYAKPLRVEELAKSVNMSLSSFHHYFKSITGMSPLQFQKMVRLQEARRQMLSEGLEAAEAAFQVGYESPSQFSREYSRMFGLPPKSDVRKIQDNLK
ncbi:MULTISPECIES: AraC family transcriptional regulator [Niallia]|uniref:AraC family transcriptional regulator n=1 Tax=Niallia alba TaxID=2729105 RepID=A0A7Y0KC40_9BACI|nr:AraC family transcriptional regulator [Niallia alba]NMO79393.1 AraC family transcriptional regulator [Niallia alba]